MDNLNQLNWGPALTPDEKMGKLVEVVFVWVDPQGIRRLRRVSGEECVKWKKETDGLATHGWVHGVKLSKYQWEEAENGIIVESAG